MTHHLKLLTAKRHQVLDIIENEKKQLDIQLKEAELSEEPFIIGAQAHLKVSNILHDKMRKKISDRLPSKSEELVSNKG